MIAAQPSTPEEPPSTPIRVAKKTKCHQRIKSIFINSRGFPNQSRKFDILLHNIDGGPVLQKLKHPPPALDAINPLFSFWYDKSLHGNSLRKNLDLSHLDTNLQEQIYPWVKNYWPVFDDHGVFVMVKNNECVIDNCNMHPIMIKKIQYIPKDTPIMHKAIATLKKVGHICQIHDG
jgi:hypothetical protein